MSDIEKPKKIMYHQPRAPLLSSTNGTTAPRTIILTAMPLKTSGSPSTVQNGYHIKRPDYFTKQATKSGLSKPVQIIKPEPRFVSIPMSPTILGKRPLSHSDANSNFSSIGIPPRKRERLTHLSPEEKFYRRKMKNRIAAQTARDRKKVKMGDLEETIAKLEAENSALEVQNIELRDKNELLQVDNAQLRHQLDESNRVVIGSAEGTDDPAHSDTDHSDLHISEFDLQAIIADLLQGSEHLQIDGYDTNGAAGEYLSDPDNSNFGEGFTSMVGSQAAPATGYIEEPVCQFIPNTSDYVASTTPQLSLSAGSPMALVPPSPFNPQSPMQLLDIDLLEKSLVDQPTQYEYGASNDAALWADSWHDTFTDLFSS